MKAVSKKSVSYDSDTEVWSEKTTTDELWLLSYSEIFGEDSIYITGEEKYFKAEGSQYAWWTKMNVDNSEGVKNYSLSNSNFCRNQLAPADNGGEYAWLRSPFVDYVGDFGKVGSDGCVNTLSSLDQKYRVVPAFAF